MTSFLPLKEVSNDAHSHMCLFSPLATRAARTNRFKDSADVSCGCLPGCRFGSRRTVPPAFSFTGTSILGNDSVDFFLSGPSFFIHSAAPGGPAYPLFICDWESTCNVPSMEIPAFMSYFSQPGDFSGGTVSGVTADSLRRDRSRSPIPRSLRVHLSTSTESSEAVR